MAAWGLIAVMCRNHPLSKEAANWCCSCWAPLVLPNGAPTSSHRCLQSIWPFKAVLSPFHIHGHHFSGTYFPLMTFWEAEYSWSNIQIYTGNTGFCLEQKTSQLRHSFLGGVLKGGKPSTGVRAFRVRPLLSSSRSFISCYQDVFVSVDRNLIIYAA